MSLQVQPMSVSTTSKPPLLNVYARNVELHAFKRGWSHKFLATRLGITPYSLTRIRYGRGRYLDAEVFASMLEIFDCQPNDLLLPQPGIDYTIPE
jgi:DNA-binding Xre family transcriptional regulator